MRHQSIKELFANESLVGSNVEVKGWVRTRRDSKAGLSFIQLHDGTAFDAIQIIVDADIENYQSEVIKLTAGCAVGVEGVLVESQGKGQSVEIQAKKVQVYGWVEDPESYPVSQKRHTFEYLRTQAHLRVRTNTFGAIARLRNTVSQAIHRFFNEQEFYWVNTPIVTASDCEGAGELFQVSTLDQMNLPYGDNKQVDYGQDFFGKKSYLTVSGQLNVEPYCCALSRVYTFGPTFRAENSNTSRHLAEFWMVEPEVAFADLNDIATLAESFLKYVFECVLSEREDDMAFFTQRIDKGATDRLESLVDSQFERLTYTEAVSILESAKKKFEFPVKWGIDLQSEHERFLSEEHVGKPVVVTDYPKDIKAFYMRANDDGKTVAAMDVLAPGIGEIIGGSQREERLDILDTKLEAMGLKEHLWWYRDLRRYGTVPHAGFGLGFERLINYISGMENIRDVIPYPRTPGNVNF